MHRVFNARARRRLPSKRLTVVTHLDLISSHSRALSYSRLGRHRRQGSRLVDDRRAAARPPAASACTISARSPARASPGGVRRARPARRRVRDAASGTPSRPPIGIDSTARGDRQNGQPGGDRSRPPGRPRMLSCSRCGQIFQITPVPGICTSGRVGRALELRGRIGLAEIAHRAVVHEVRAAVRSELEVRRAVDSAQPRGP